MNLCNRVCTRWRLVMTTSVALLVVSHGVGRLPSPALSAPTKEPMPKQAASSTAKNASPVLVAVNGHPITEENLEFLKLTVQLENQKSDETQKILLEQLVDRELVREFLESRKAEADKRQLDDQVGRIHRLIRRQGKEPSDVLSKLGYGEDRLREELALGLAWQVHLRRMVTTTQIEEYFTQHREQLDGTELRASQILIKLSPEATEAEAKKASEDLSRIREQIVAKQMAFADAAREHSQAPSREVGGDLGFFPFRGRMPVEFTQVAFGLKAGEISQPFRTRFGVHLCTVTERKPGQLSLEDARPEILQRLSNEIWKQVVAERRSQAKIEWSEKAPR